MEGRDRIMGREIKELSFTIQDRINRLRRLVYHLDKMDSNTNENILETLDTFLKTNLSIVEFELLKVMIEDNTPLTNLSENRIREIAKALGIAKYRYLSKRELLLLIDQEGEVYGTTYSHPNAPSKRNLRKLCTGGTEEDTNLPPKET